MKKLLIFTVWDVGDDGDFTPESNLWYLRRYESYFDEICHVYLLGRRTEKVVENGRSKYVFIGTGNNKLDFLCAPFRLYKFASEYEPYAYLAVEQVWLPWVIWLVKILLNAKIYLLPVTYPEAMYKLTGRSLSGRLPIWLERILISFSYRSADFAVTSENLGSYVDWISANPILRRKLILAKSMPEAIPTMAFFDAISKAEQNRARKPSGEPFRLIYIGRFHFEKSVDDLIRMMQVLKQREVRAHLTMIGDGSDRVALEDLTRELEVADRISFLGWKTNHELPRYLVESDVFVSPSTGGSLREAALCGVPVVAYDMDWIKGLLEDRKNFLAVSPNDWTEMADKIELLLTDQVLREKLSEEIRSLGWNLWSDAEIDASLRMIYSHHRRPITESV